MFRITFWVFSFWFSRFFRTGLLGRPGGDVSIGGAWRAQRLQQPILEHSPMLSQWVHNVRVQIGTPPREAKGRQVG